jgi:hypothetical protein
MKRPSTRYQRERLYSRDALLLLTRHVIRHLLALSTLVEYFYASGEYKEERVKNSIRGLVSLLQDLEDELEN